MKGSVLRVACCVVMAAIGSGCTTITNPDGTTKRVVDPVVLQTVAQDAAAVGATVYLQDHPQARPAFETARNSLKTLLDAGNGSVADLQADLAALPIKELQGRQGVVIVSSAVTLIDLAGRELRGADKQKVWENFVQPVAKGLKDGLDQALAQ